MSRRTVLMVLVATTLCGVGIAYAVGAVNLSASEDPGRLETVIALRVKQWFTERAVAPNCSKK